MSHLDTEARHVVDMVHALLDEAHAAEGPLVERVRGVLAQATCRTIERNDAESSLAMLREERDDALRRLAAAQGGRDNFGAKLDRIADLVFPLGLRGHGDDAEAVVRRVVGRLNGLQVERDEAVAERDAAIDQCDAARDDAREARAIVTRVRLLLKDLLAAGGES